MGQRGEGRGQMSRTQASFDRVQFLSRSNSCSRQAREREKSHVSGKEVVTHVCDWHEFFRDWFTRSH